MYKVKQFMNINGNSSTVYNYENFLRNNQNIKIISVNVIGNIIFLTY
ncbi:acetate CoA-transferase [Clostridium saccharoperbutylacetonicum]